MPLGLYGFWKWLWRYEEVAMLLDLFGSLHLVNLKSILTSKLARSSTSPTASASPRPVPSPSGSTTAYDGAASAPRTTWDVTVREVVGGLWRCLERVVDEAQGPPQLGFDCKASFYFSRHAWLLLSQAVMARPSWQGRRC